MIAASTTALGDRLLLTSAMLAIMALIYLAMWRGWRRPGDLDLLALPGLPGEWHPRFCVDGIYASTTRAGEWLSRVRSHGLGQRSAGRACVGSAGVLLERRGSLDLFIPRAQITAVSLTPGIAGKVVGGRGMVVITWTWGEHRVDTGFFPEADRRTDLVAAIRELVDD